MQCISADHTEYHRKLSDVTNIIDLIDMSVLRWYYKTIPDNNFRLLIDVL